MIISFKVSNRSLHNDNFSIWTFFPLFCVRFRAKMPLFHFVSFCCGLKWYRNFQFDSAQQMASVKYFFNTLKKERPNSLKTLIFKCSIIFADLIRYILLFRSAFLFRVFSFRFHFGIYKKAKKIKKK